MNKISKIFNTISTLSCLIMIISISIFNSFVNELYINGYIILILLGMLLNPIANLCRINQKIIINPIYHILTTIVTGFTSYVAINSLLIYYNNLNGTSDNSDALNNSVNYFGDYFLYVLCGLLFIIVISFIFKKIKSVAQKRINIIYVIILMTSITPLLNRAFTFKSVWALTEALFILVIFIKNRGINTTDELQKYYLILILLSILSINPIALVLSIYIFIQLDNHKLHL